MQHVSGAGKSLATRLLSSFAAARAALRSKSPLAAGRGMGASASGPAAAAGPAAALSDASPAPALRSLDGLAFDNTFADSLPGDDSGVNRVRQVHGAFHSAVAPTPTGTEPTTLAASADVARLIGLDPREAESPEFALVFSGSAPLPAATGSRTYAQCYGGHQFGMWAGRPGGGGAGGAGAGRAGGAGRWSLEG